MGSLLSRLVELVQQAIKQLGTSDLDSSMIAVYMRMKECRAARNDVKRRTRGAHTSPGRLQRHILQVTLAVSKHS